MLSLVPSWHFKEKRELLALTYGEVYQRVDGVEETLSEFSNEELREWARSRARSAPDHDPHPNVTLLTRTLGQLKSSLKIIAILLMIVGTILSIAELQAVSTDIYGLPATLSDLVPQVILIGIGGWLYLLRADTFAHQFLNHDLRVKGGRLSTRDSQRLIGYGIFNGSLHRQRGLMLLTILVVMGTLPKWPLIGRWFNAPDEYALQLVHENANEIHQCDGYRDVVAVLRENI